MHTQEKGVRVVLTGGHAATTAIAVVEELIRRSQKDNLELYWIGSKYAYEGRKEKTLEEKIFPNLGIKNISIPAGRVQRRFTLWTIPSLLKIPVGFVSACWILLKIRPRIIVSFGGYAAFPVVVVGKLLRIPIIIHEQTAAAGRVNRITAWAVSKVALAREESRHYFPDGKTVLTGNPIMTQIAEIKPKSVMGNPPTIFITLGSRGARPINEVVLKLLPTLLRKYRVIHLTGDLDFSKFQSLKSDNYVVMSTCDPLSLDNLYRQADVIIARAGANTVAEIISTKIPSILIPIPWSYLDEQTANAKIAQRLGIAKIIPQDQLNDSYLLKEIETIIINWETMVHNAQSLPIADARASSNLVNLIEQYLK